ncbi:MAG: M55 family metallopeptidase [Eubacteriales bacterium]|nr:M55 family metallopeptidase [Eubacteriales bacterium]
MKIYIHTDLEGISGIGKMEMIDRAGPDFQEAVSLMMGDINAAVEGAFEGGAKEVTVLDSHGGGGNFDMGALDKRAVTDPKENKKWWGMLDESYCGTFFIGAHAMAGTINGFLDHTQSSKTWFNYIVNGRRMGELAQWAIVAGHFGVPMLMVSGDEAACAEARQFFGNIECVPVKQGLGRNRAMLYDPGECRQKIRLAAARAVSMSDKARPFKPLLPMEIKLELYRSDYCDSIAAREGVERLDARTVRKIAATGLDLFM